MSGNRLGADRLISICIPTYRRPDLVAQALDSCFAQTYPWVEIVVGDDSPDDLTKRVVARYIQQHPMMIRYRHHVPSLGQNGNVNDLFARAEGDRLVLLHDDDVLLPNAIKKLAALWDSLPTLDAAFGKQCLVEHDGTPALPERTLALNAGYHRLPANAGRQTLPVVAGLLRMFPNDGYMVSKALARQIGYRSRKEVGDACDTDFGLRLCAVAREIWFLDEFIVKYRLSNDSISKHSIVEPYTYDMLSNLKVPREVETILKVARREIVPGAVSGFARLGQTGRAWQLLVSPDYAWRRRLSPRGAYHLLLILGSLVRTARTIDN